MFSRLAPIQRIVADKSILLLGPRQTGKSTLLKMLFTEALVYDLLDPNTFRTLSADPGSLVPAVDRYIRLQTKTRPNLPPIILIDEVQRISEILNTVHLLIEKHKEARFVLTGSSARKLRRGGVNLLGGRAILIRMHPLASAELSSWPDACRTWKDLIQISALPAILTARDPELELQAYTELYLRQEIEVEAAVKNLPDFSRFLTVAAGANGQQIIFEKIAARTGISAKMAQSWFQILQDTMFGSLLPTFKETVKREPVATPKFYLFDCGIARFLQGRHTSPILDDGVDLESFILQELLCWKDYSLKPIEVSYWRSKTKAEVDFVLSYGKRHVAIEIKTTKRLTQHDFSGLKVLGEEEQLALRRILVNPWVLSQDRDDGIEVLSVEDFLDELWKDRLFP